ncbi:MULTISPECIES: enolase C-terminal domain-like protein [Streptomyces]|uniref:Enolase C-terminal domain-like protein n=1 Tax=Streptomyces sp. R17 TaxID=3238626 RepID=A0AB39NTH3_9ACTN|nr:enolase C-terminal domain-like protein [Streptomyces sp. MMS20-AI2-20]MCI4140730.1 mandelate racemase [Streptomyces sp. MMS20-AI2-20]GGP96883.1 mandelate racemase [Streptomyces gancidicus]
MTQEATGGRPLDGGPAVERLAVSVYRIPTDLPGGDATLTWDATTLVLVEATAAGVTGLGFTYGSPATAPVVRQELADLVVGHDAFDVPAAGDRMSRALRNTGRPGIGAGAVSAVDTALWDLKARLLDLPLVRLLGAARKEVAVYGSGGLTTYDDTRLEEQLRGWTEQGVGRVKIKVAESWGRREARDLHRTVLARRTVGDTAELYVDANGGYTRKQAVRMAAALADLGVIWLEEPVSSDDLTGLREVREAVAPDVAAGEYGYDLPYFARMAASGAVDCLQADVTRCGGITVWLRAAAVAEGLGLHISGHCAPHLHAHVAAAVPNTRHLEWFHDHVRIENMMFHGTLDPRGGTVSPGASGEPGHGLTLDRAAADRYRTA